MKKLYLFLRDGKLFYGSSLDDATALEVVNSDANIQLALGLALGGFVQHEQLYDLPQGWTVEIKQLKTWENPTEKDPFWRCDECCNGDRCDDPTHYYRKDCPYCKGSGKLSSDKIARLIPLKEQSSGITYMHDRECRRYRDESVLCQDHCYFKSSGIKECPTKPSGIAAIGVPEYAILS